MFNEKTKSVSRVMADVTPFNEEITKQSIKIGDKFKLKNNRIEVIGKTDEFAICKVNGKYNECYRWFDMANIKNGKYTEVEEDE